MKFEADLSFAPTAEGGRQTPVISGYRPDAWFGAMEGEERVLHGIHIDFSDPEIRPGETKRARITVRVPEAFDDYGITLDRGTTFEVQEGHRVVAHGSVARVGHSKDAAT